MDQTFHIVVDASGAYILRRPPEDVGDGLFESKTGLSEGAGADEHPQNFDRGHQENGSTGCILESQTNKQGDHEADVGGEDVEDELLDVVEDAAALFDGVEDGGEVIVREHDVRRVLRHVRARAHGNTDVRALEARAVVHPVSRHRHVPAPPVQRLDHPHLGAGRATRHHHRQPRQRVDLGIC